MDTPVGPWRFEANGGWVWSVAPDAPVAEEAIEPDRLYLPSATPRLYFAPLIRHLHGMRFYSLELDSLRKPEPPSAQAVLDPRGGHLASVLGAMEEDDPSHKDRMDSYIQAVVPGVISVDRWEAGPFVTVKLRTIYGRNGHEVDFDPTNMSDGTIRAIGILAALFQPAARDGRISLIGIEEPETALHPAAAGALFDALHEASDQVQVLATSQSPDLLDRDDIDVDVVRAVSMDQGLTTIGEVDEASRSIVRDKLYTLGELMRTNQISPGNPPNGHAASAEA